MAVRAAVEAASKEGVVLVVDDRGSAEKAMRQLIQAIRINYPKDPPTKTLKRLARLSRLRDRREAPAVTHIGTTGDAHRARRLERMKKQLAEMEAQVAAQKICDAGNSRPEDCGHEQGGEQARRDGRREAEPQPEKETGTMPGGA